MPWKPTRTANKLPAWQQQQQQQHQQHLQQQQLRNIYNKAINQRIAQYAPIVNDTAAFCTTVPSLLPLPLAEALCQSRERQRDIGTDTGSSGNAIGNGNSIADGHQIIDNDLEPQLECKLQAASSFSSPAMPPNGGERQRDQNHKSMRNGPRELQGLRLFAFCLDSRQR